MNIILILALLVVSALLSDAGRAASQEQSISGGGALALAALIGENAALPLNEKAVLANLLAGNPDVAGHAGRAITVSADRIICRAGNVDLTDHSCVIVFGSKNVDLSGRAAHELYATLAEVGVTREGAAGVLSQGVSRLACSIDPQEIASKTGGGAQCRFTPASP